MATTPQGAGGAEQRPPTCCGTSWFVNDVPPTCQFALEPHAQTAPSDLRASACWSPAAMAVTPARTGDDCGARRAVVVPSPSCPVPLPPHVQSVPSAFNAMVKVEPATIAPVIT